MILAEFGVLSCGDRILEGIDKVIIDEKWLSGKGSWTTLSRLSLHCRELFDDENGQGKVREEMDNEQ